MMRLFAVVTGTLLCASVASAGPSSAVAFDQATHGQYLIANRFELLVEALRDMTAERLYFLVHIITQIYP